MLFNTFSIIMQVLSIAVMLLTIYVMLEILKKLSDRPKPTIKQRIERKKAEKAKSKEINALNELLDEIEKY